MIENMNGNIMSERQKSSPSRHTLAPGRSCTRGCFYSLYGNLPCAATGYSIVAPSSIRSIFCSSSRLDLYRSHDLLGGRLRSNDCFRVNLLAGHSPVSRPTCVHPDCLPPF